METQTNILHALQAALIILAAVCGVNALEMWDGWLLCWGLVCLFGAKVIGVEISRAEWAEELDKINL